MSTPRIKKRKRSNPYIIICLFVYLLRRVGNAAVGVLLCTRDSRASFLFASDSSIICSQAPLKNVRYKRRHIPIFSKTLFDWRRLERFWITFCDRRKNQDFRLLKGVEMDSGWPSKDWEGALNVTLTDIFYKITCFFYAAKYKYFDKIIRH